MNEARDEIQNLVSLSNEAIEMSSPVEKVPSVSIVGLPREYSKDEVILMLVLQNGYIKQFATSNDITNHITIFSPRYFVFL